MNRLLFSFILCCGCFNLYAQQHPQQDSFFLAKKKGILGTLGKSISTNDAYIVPKKTVDPYKQYYGKVIRHIIINPAGFNNRMGSTSPIKTNLFINVAEAMHLNSDEKLIRKNLFFREGQKFYPLKVADNERFLRTLEYLRDAIIKVLPDESTSDTIDVVVLTRDVFSLGGSIHNLSANKIDADIVEESFGGSGNNLTLNGLYEKDRNPVYGYGASYMQRNIGGSFINWTNGFKTYHDAFNSGRQEETIFFSKMERPMVSRYTAVTGAVELGYHKTSNTYVSDSLYQSDFKYTFINTDLWTGFNFGYKDAVKKDEANHLRHFAAFRTFFNFFYEVPDKYKNLYNYQYANLNGFLLSYSIFRQNFYRTNFIYGFGRNEDVPEGIKAGLIGGFTNKDGEKRTYLGTEVEYSEVNKRSRFFSYTVRAGGFIKKKEWQDVDMLVNIKHYGRLHTINNRWYNRNYVDLSFTRQINAFLNEPLFLNSEFGLPYYSRGLMQGKMRTAVRMESVFYHMNKFLGFRFAPFVTADLGLLQELGEPLKKTSGYPVVGGGIRTRNESLVFGTMEVKALYFPRPIDGMKSFRIEFGTNLRFKYNSDFIRRPDFVSPN
jgi:hypothetical protein